MLALCCGASAYAQERPLFAVPERPGVSLPGGVADDPATIRHRLAAVPVDRLSELHRAVRSRHSVLGERRGVDAAADSLALNLFDDVVVRAVVERADSTISDGFVLSGGIAGDPFGDFVLAVVEGAVAGTVHADGAHYELVSAGDGLITVIESEDEFECGVEELTRSGGDATSLGGGEDEALGDDGRTDTGTDGIPAGDEAAEGAAGGSAARRAPQASAPASPAVLAAEKAVLEALYTSAGGTGWDRRDQWGSSAAVGEWYGVDTAADGRVRKISLNRNGLVGTLPATLANLSGLKALRLHENPSLEGSLPASITAVALSELTYWGTDLCVPDTPAVERWAGTMRTFDGHYCQSSSSTEITIAVPFIAAVREFYHGTAGAKARAAALVASTNRALADSGALVTVRLVASEEMAYPKRITGTSDIIEALIRMRDRNDGYLDGVHAFRDRNEADVVMLLAGSGGVAWNYTYYSTKGDPAAGFGVSNPRGSNSFAHEFGHFLGLSHDRHVGCIDDACIAGAGLVYGFGYISRPGIEGTGALWRTIMAYPTLCPAGCSAIRRYSNPALTWGNPRLATGVPGTYYTGDTWGPADAVRTMNWTRRVVSRYRVPQALTVSFDSTSATATEGGAAASVTVRLSAAAINPKRIPLSVTLHGGASPDDYSAPTAIVFAPGQQERTLVVRAVNDADDDDGESVLLGFAEDLPTGVTTGAWATVTVALRDNDGAVGVPPLRLGGASVFETNGPARFPVRLTAAQDGPIVVTYATADVTATAGADYTSSSGSVMIATGATEGEIAVPILVDGVAEGAETFSVTASATVGTRQARATATGTIVDTKGIPSASSGVAPVPSGWALTPTGETAAGSEFRLLFATSSARAATATEIAAYNRFVQDRAAAGHAALGPYAAGFRVLGKTATADAATNASLPATTSADPVPVYWLNGNRVVADSAGLLGGSWVGRAPTDENGAARTGACPLGGTGPCMFTGHDANALDGWVLGGGDDVFGGTGKWVTVGRPGAAGRTVDADEQARPTALLPFYGLSPVFRVQSGLVLPAASAAGGRWRESAGEAAFTVSLDRAAAHEASVAYATVDATAAAGLDYTAVSGRLTFAVGERTKTVSVPLAADAVDEPDESFVLVLGAPRNATLSATGAAATGVIAGAADLPELSLLGPPRAVLESSGTAVFTATLSRAAPREVTASYRTTPRSAGAEDFTAASGTLTIAAGGTRARVAVSIVDDAAFEPEESFSLDLLDVSGARAVGGMQAVATLVDDDTPEPATGTLVQLVAADWAFVPASLTAVGSEFHVLFVTSMGRDATSRDIDDYNRFVQDRAAAGHSAIRSHAGAFRALGSTLRWPEGGVTAFANTGTNPTSTTGRPVYWLDGGKIAGTYRDFFDVRAEFGARRYWQSRAPTDEHGRAVTRNCNVRGAPHVCAFTGFAPRHPLGSLFASTGVPTLTPGTDPEPALDLPTAVTSAAEVRPLYGLSPAFRVAAAGHVFPAVSIADATGAENGGPMAFTVSLSAATTVDVVLFYETVRNGSASDTDVDLVSGTARIAAGATQGTISVPLLDDPGSEPDETFTVRIRHVTNATLEDADARGTITDDDQLPNLRFSSPQVQEGDTAKMRVEFERWPGDPVWLEWRATDGTASGRDFPYYVGYLPLQNVSHISMPTKQDSRREPDETFRICVTIAAGGFFDDGTSEQCGTVTILDDDGERLFASISASARRVPEGGSVDVSVSLNSAAGRNLEIGLGAQFRGGASAADFGPIPSSLTIERNTERRTFTLNVVDDVEDDDGENLLIRFAGLPQGVVAAGGRSVIVGIQDDDDFSIQLSRPALTISEGGSGTYGVSLGSQPTGTVRITVTAPAGTDLRFAPATLDFNETTYRQAQTVTVRAVEDNDDALAEAPVVLTHTAAGSNYDGARAVALTVTIEENDRATVSVRGSTVREDAGRAPFEVSLSMLSTAIVTFDYATADDTARAPGDYRRSRGTLRFSSRVDRHTVWVPVVGDDNDEEETETFSFTLSNAVNSVFAGGAPTVSAVGHIVDDDDPRVAASFATDAYTVAEAGGAATLEVRLDRDPERPLTLPLVSTPGGGASELDYAVPADVRFAPGEMAQRVEVTATDDADDDDGEHVAVSFGPLPDRVWAGAPAVATVRIVDDDAPGIVVPDPPTVTVDEDGTRGYPVKLATRPSGDVTVATAVRGNDALSAAPAALVFTPTDWLHAQTVTLTADDDDNLIVEAPATVVHTASGADYGDVSAAVTVRVAENDVATVSVANAAADEGDGQVAFAVRLDQPSSAEVTVDYATASLVATAPADFAATRGRLRLAPGATESTVRVRVVDDDVDEAETESFELTLERPVNAAFQGGVAVLRATGSIRDDDIPLVRLSFDRPVHTAAEGGRAAAVAVAVDRDPERRLVVGLTATPASGAGAGDYRAPASVAFEAGGALTATVSVAAVDDDDDEGEERVVMAFDLPARSTAGTHPQTTVHLIDNDGPGLVVSDPTPEVPEGGSATFTVALGSRPTAAVTVTVSVGPGEVSASPSSLSFARDAWSEPLAVVLTADADGDLLAEEPVTVTLAASGGGYQGQSAAVTATIVETGRATIAVGDAAAAEGEGSVGFAVTLDRPGSNVVTVAYATADGTATAPEDYVATSGVLRFAARETARTIRVPVRDDAEDDAAESETFSLTLHDATQAVFAGGAAAVTVTGRIDDDDDPRVRVSFGTAVHTAREGGDPAHVAVRIDRDPERSVTVPLAATYGTGAGIADHSALPASVSFAAGGPLTRTVEVVATDDQIDEDTETVSLGFTGLAAGVAAGQPAATTVHLLDDDRRGLVVSTDPVSVPDGGSEGYTVGLASRPTEQVVVALSLSAAEGLSVSPTRLTFAPDAWSTPMTVTLTSVGDDDLIPGEPVQVTHLATGGDYRGVLRTVTASVQEDVPTVSVGSEVVASESAEHMDFVVSASATGGLGITLDYATTDGTAVAGADYTATVGTLTFAAEATRRTIRVPVTAGDDEDEAIESKTFDLVLRNVARATFAGGAGFLTATGRIQDDDVPEVVVSLGADAYGVSESDTATPAVVDVRVDRDPERTVVVPFELTHVDGASAADYHGPGEVRFAAGGPLVQRARFFANDDAFDDDGEAVAIGFGTLPARVTAGTARLATLRITDDDERSLAATVSALLVREGQAAKSYFVGLGTAPTGEVTVRLELDPAGSDVVVSPDRLVFAAGARVRQRIRVSAQVDADGDVDEPVTIRHVATGGGYDGFETSVIVSIIEKDRPVVQLGNFSANEADGTLDFAVTLDKAHPEKPVTVEYRTVDGTAEAPADYTAASGTLTFDVGETARTVAVVVINDEDDEEEEETLGLVLSNPVNAEHDPGEPSRTADGVIVDDDDPRVKVTYGTEAFAVYEGDPEVTQALIGNLDQPSAGGTTAFGISGALQVDQDFATGPHPRGYLLHSVKLHVLQTEPGAVPRVAVVGGTRQGGYVELVGPADPGANDTAEPDVFTPPPNTVLDAGTAYSLVVGVTTPPGIIVDVAAGSAPDAGAAPGWTLAPRAVSATTVNQPAGPLRVSVVGSPVVEAIVTVAVDRDPERTIEVPLTSAPAGGAVASDYAGVPTAVTFEAAKPLERRFAVRAPQDEIAEIGEHITLGFASLPERVEEADDSLGRVDILDDDVHGVVLTPSALTLPEGATATYEVALASEPVGAVAVSVTVPNGAALAATPSRLQFAAATWKQRQTVTLTATLDADAVVPPPATLEHTASGADYGNVAAGLTVNVSETSLPELSFEATALTVAENAGSVTLTVQMNLPSSRRVEVGVVTADGTAYGSRAGFTGDFATSRRVLTFEPGGALTRTATVTINDDARHEENETFLVQLLAPANAEVGASAIATVTITNDDDAPLHVAFGRIVEGPPVVRDPPPLPEGPRLIGNLVQAGGTTTIWRIGGTGLHEGCSATTIGRACVQAARVSFRTGSEFAAYAFDGVRLHLTEYEENTVPRIMVAEHLAGRKPESAEECGSDAFECIRLANPDTYPVPGKVDFRAPPDSVLKPDTTYTLLLEVERRGQWFNVAITSNLSLDGRWRGWSWSALEIDNGFAQWRAYTPPELGGTFLVVDMHGNSLTPSTAVLLSVSPARAQEDGGGKSLEVTGRLNGASRGAQTSVALSLGGAGDTASSADYGQAAATLLVPAGERFGVVELTLTPVNDVEKEYTETVSVVGTTADLSVIPTVVQIGDDDRFETIAVDLLEAQYADVDVTVSAQPGQSIEVPIVSERQGGASEADYTPVTTVLTFDASEPLSRTFRITVTDDSIDDDGETVSYRIGTLTAGVAAVQPGEVRIGILDDDTRGVAVVPPVVEIEEGETGGYQVVLASAPTGNVEVR